MVSKNVIAMGTKDGEYPQKVDSVKLETVTNAMVDGEDLEIELDGLYIYNTKRYNPMVGVEGTIRKRKGTVHYVLDNGLNSIQSIALYGYTVNIEPNGKSVLSRITALAY